MKSTEFGREEEFSHFTYFHLFVWLAEKATPETSLRYKYWSEGNVYIKINIFL